MSGGSRTAVALVVAAAVVGSAGCGSSGSASSSRTGAATHDEPAPIPPRSDLALPVGVPDRPTGPAAADAKHVINGWLRALRRGDISAAAHYFALPSKFQNGTPVLTIDQEEERIAITLSFACGARAVAMGAAGPYTIVTFRLTDRPGAMCGTGVGARARGAIRVAGRRIREWYRLPDRPGGEQRAPPAPSGPAI
jgi:hypothetical protein